MKPKSKLSPVWIGLLPLFILAMVVGLDACQRKQTYYTTVSGVKIPKEVQRYLVSLAAKDTVVQRATFARKAVITDEIGSFDTEAELTTWLNHHNAIHKRVEVLANVPIQNGHTLLMRWIPQQEQQQWTAYYTFEYEAGRIARLHIRSDNTYAQNNLPVHEPSLTNR